jgi:hypothetical protein
VTRYAFDEVRAALGAEWGFEIRRGDADVRDRDRDGRWDTVYSKTGYIVSGNFPGYGHRHKRYRSLAAIVRGCKLAQALASARSKKKTRRTA